MSKTWGYDRGTPIDRYYIEHFLGDHRLDIRGRVLEIKDSGYTARFGTNVEQTSVLDIDSSNPKATIIADLAAADQVPSNHFDCFILTQTLQMIYAPRAAIAHAHRIMRPGGTLLATLPALCRIERASIESDYWRFTTASCSALFSEIFGSEQISVRTYGNVLSAMAFLTGMACEELSRRELDTLDILFPVIIAVRAIKKESALTL